jgi:kumamolisin
MSRSRTRARWPLIALCSSLVVLALPLTIVPASASLARVVVAGLQPLPTTDVVVNKVITTSFDLALTQRHQRELAPFIASLTNTASGNYHHFLTPTQYARRFGASASTVNAVEGFLKSFGLRVGALSKGRNILHVSGTTSAIAHAFDAPVETVRQGDGTLVAHFGATASLPHSLSNDVIAVAGLSSVVPKSINAIVSHAVGAPSTCPSAGTTVNTTNSQGGYNAQQQGQLYGLGAAWALGHTGAGQTIGVYELANYNTNDVITFLSCYGVTPNITPFTVGTGPSNTDNSASASNEATLDVEEASVLAPGAKIEVYQGTNSGSGPTDVYSQIASDNTATIVTTSWGGCEPQSDGGAQAEMPIFEEMATQGQTIIAAAGDDGSSDCEGSGSLAPTTVAAVDDPASQPYVTGVGGLTVSSIFPLSETVWNDACTTGRCGAGGGGVSTLWSQPAWQTGNGITTTATSGGMRMVPDLSVMGDPGTGFIEFYSGTTISTCQRNCSTDWMGIGGTSIGAPLVSALVAVGAQTCNPVGGRLGFINPSLYEMATTGFNDVTTGTNDLFRIGNYPAGIGYDMASGLGSPNGQGFFAGICPPAFSAALSSFALSSSTGTALGASPTVNATLRNVNGAPVVNAVFGVSATAPGGLVTIDSAHSSAISSGKATYLVTSDATGAVTFNVSSSVDQNVAVNVTYQGQSIYKTTLTFKAAVNPTFKPGPPTITKLTSLVAGFSLKLTAPSNTGGSPITSYQYSINGGATWISLAKGARSVNVTRLIKSHSYRVIVRAINAIGASAPSAAKKVVTRS